MEKIRIYTQENCTYCEQVKEKLKESSIEFTEINIADSKEEWIDVVSLTNNPTTPTIRIGSEFLLSGRDFQQPQHLIDIISNFKESTYDENRRILELLKTVNFHIFAAFQKVGNKFQQIESKLQQIENNTKKEEENEHESTS